MLAALRQPYNQNEYLQMSPYGSGDVDKIIHGTRQPPLDPLLGALVQSVLGEGQLRQRLVPILAGVGTLIVLGLLLRRLFTPTAAVVAVWIMATQPMMVRYSAYARPYALPLFFAVVFLYAVTRWLDRRHPGDLVLAGIAAVLMPLTRVPEPMALLVVSALVLGWISWRKPQMRDSALPAAILAAVVVLTVGAFEVLTLGSQLQDDTASSSQSQRASLREGVEGLVHLFLPALARQFPWWPVTLLLVIVVIVWGRARRRLVAAWVWWPLLAGPVAFALASYLANPLHLRRYYDRYAYFFVPILVMLVAALVTAAMSVTQESSTKGRAALGWRPICAAGLVAMVLLGQLPATAKVLTDKQAADFVMASDVLRSEVPKNALVIFDSPSSPGKWRQGFTGRARNLGGRPRVQTPEKLADKPQAIPAGPVYLLVLDPNCASQTLCTGKSIPWDDDIPGWSLVRRFDHFRLYAPELGQAGPDGAVDGLTALSRAFGGVNGLKQVYSAATVLKALDREAEGRALIRQYYLTVPEADRASLRARAQDADLDPFR